MFNAWIVFQWQPDPYANGQMERMFVGAFDDPEKADTVCTSEDHYVFPVEMNHADNGEPHLYQHAYYPRCPWRTEEARKNAQQEVSEK